MGEKSICAQISRELTFILLFFNILHVRTIHVRVPTFNCLPNVYYITGIICDASISVLFFRKKR